MEVRILSRRVGPRPGSLCSLRLTTGMGGWERKPLTGKSILASQMPSQVCECPSPGTRRIRRGSPAIQSIKTMAQRTMTMHETAPGATSVGKGPTLTLASPLAGAHEVRDGTALISQISSHALRLQAPSSPQSTPANAAPSLSPAEQFAKAPTQTASAMWISSATNYQQREGLSAGQRQTPQDRNLNVER